MSESSLAAPPAGVVPYGPPISADEARTVAQAAEAEAARRGWTVVIAVVDSGGNLSHLHRMDHAQFGSIEIALAKAKTAVNFKRPTLQFQEALEHGGVNLRLLGAESITPFEGGVPLIRDGAIVGGLGISGMRPPQDSEVAEAGAAAFCQ